mgnify:CR=1 FL=1|jgi:hypothetical protein|tara:strand:- start:4279 stop:4449 length:171 start_codon:yes stop_codon:yes gene_type:complete
MQATAKVTEITVLTTADLAAIENVLSGAAIVVSATIIFYCLYLWRKSSHKRQADLS